jgi:hypothetical protein
MLTIGKHLFITQRYFGEMVRSAHHDMAWLSEHRDTCNYTTPRS